MFDWRDRWLLACAVAIGVFWNCPWTRAQEGVRAITRPSADVTLSFVQPGRIAQIHFQEGDSVGAGQVLVQEDDDLERAQLAQLEADSDNLTQMRAAEASLAQKRIDLEKLQTAAERNAATPLEVQHAQLEVRIAELSLEMARFEHEQAGRKCRQQEILVKQMQLASPIDGRIEKVHVEAGESVNALADVVQVVQIDPLWIEVPVSLAQALTLRTNQTATAAFSGAEDVTLSGRITFIGAVADAGSDTLRVRVAVPNEAGRPAGEHVVVTFPE